MSAVSSRNSAFLGGRLFHCDEVHALTIFVFLTLYIDRDSSSSSSYHFLGTQRSRTLLVLLSQKVLCSTCCGKKHTVDDKQAAAFMLGAIDNILPSNGFYH